MQFSVAFVLASLVVLHTARALENEWDPDADSPAGFRQAFYRSYGAEGGASTLVTLTPEQLSKGAVSECAATCKANKECLAVQPSPSAKGPGKTPPTVTGCRIFTQLDGVKARIAESNENPGPPVLVYEERAIGDETKDERDNPCATYLVDYVDEDSGEQILCKPKGWQEPPPTVLPKGFERAVRNAHRPRGGSVKIVKGKAGTVTNEWCAKACAKDKKCLAFQMRPGSRNMFIENLKEDVVSVGKKPNSCALYTKFGKNFYTANGYTNHVRGGRDFVIYADRAKTTCKDGQYFGWVFGDGSLSKLGCQRVKKEGESCVGEETSFVDITNKQNGCAPGLTCRWQGCVPGLTCRWPNDKVMIWKCLKA